MESTFTPLRIKAIQNHNEWSSTNVQDALPEHERFISLDNEYGATDFQAGVAPTIVYHYTHRAAFLDVINMGLIYGGNRTGARFTFLTKEDPWTISGTDYAAMAATRPVRVALDLQMMILNGHRLIETTAGTILCPDWIPNKYVIYVYDMDAKCYSFANHVYAHLRGIHTGQTKAFYSARTGDRLLMTMIWWKVHSKSTPLVFLVTMRSGAAKWTLFHHLSTASFPGSMM